jgi:mannose-6-phosphate isomerase
VGAPEHTVDTAGREMDVRPWGSYIVIDEAADHKIKRIVVHPNKRLSLQVHEKRSEHWFIVRGRGVVTLDATVVEVGPGDSVDVEVGMAHRIENSGDSDLVFVEVQHGSYFGEDDIIRIEDDFGRTSP